VFSSASKFPRTRNPRGWPLLGHLPAFYKDKLAFLDRCAESTLPVIQLQVGEPTILLREPTDIGYVLQEAASSFAKSPLISGEQGRRLFGQGVLTSSGDRHRRLRAALQPVFSRASAMKFAPAVVESVNQITTSWRDGDVLNLGEVMPGIAQTVASQLLFGPGYSPRSAELNQAFRTRREYLQFRFSFPFSWSERLPIPLRFRYQRAMRTIRDYVQVRIADARRQPDSSCLLGLMAATALTDEESLDEGIALGVTGYEPIGESLVWTMWLIACHPEVQAKLHAEAVQYSRQGLPDSTQLPYTWAVLQESMRLYPPTWLFLRYATMPVTLPSGASVPTGTKLYLSPWIIHRDPRFYEEPLRFRPERFIAPKEKQRPRLAYFPFGAGVRMCLGTHFTELEGTLILASLIRDFNLNLLSAGPIRPKPRITLQAANPIRVRMERRLLN
jgi:cytochrome P450